MDRLTNECWLWWAPVGSSYLSLRVFLFDWFLWMLSKCFWKFQHQPCAPCDPMTQKGSAYLLPAFPGVCYFWFSGDRLREIHVFLWHGKRADFNVLLSYKFKRNIHIWKRWLWQPQYHQDYELTTIWADILHRSSQVCKWSRKHRSLHSLVCSAPLALSKLHKSIRDCRKLQNAPNLLWLCAGLMNPAAQLW